MEKTSETNKRIAKNTFLLYVRMLFTMAVSLYTSRVVLNTLGIEDYGLYNVVGGFVSMFTFLNGAMASATQRFLNFELGCGNKERLHKVFCTSINIHALISVIILLLSETIGLWFVYTHLNIPPDRFSAALWVYHASVLATIVMVMSIPYNAVIIAHERMGAFAYISVLEVVLKLLIVYLLVISDIDKLKLYAILMLLIQLLIRFIYGNYSGRHFVETRYRWIWDKDLFKEMTGFAGWSLFGNIAAVAFTQGLNVLLNMFFGPALNAARGIAVQVQNAVVSFTTNFQTAINPQLIQSVAKNDFTRARMLLRISSKFSFFLLCLLGMPLIAIAPLVLNLWLKEVPEHTVWFVRLMLVISIWSCIANPLRIVNQAEGNIRKFQLYEGTVLLMIVPISYIVLKVYKIPELVFVVHLVIELLSSYIRIKIVLPKIRMSIKDYFKSIYLPLFAIFSITILFFVFLTTHIGLKDNISSSILLCLLLEMFMSLLIYTVGLNKEERGKIILLLNTKLKNK